MVEATTPQQHRTLFIVVDTFDKVSNAKIGTRIVDLHHYGTKEWMFKHQWWALQRGHKVEIRTASVEETAEYTLNGAQALADKFPSKGVAKKAA